MLSAHVQVLAALYGPVLPCPPFLYGVVVGPGPDFISSGFSGDNELLTLNQSQYVLGTSVAPDEAAMREWIEYPVEALLSGLNPMGGWSPCRSSVVEWGSDRKHYYYKSGDDSAFDLVY